MNPDAGRDAFRAVCHGENTLKIRKIHTDSEQMTNIRLKCTFEHSWQVFSKVREINMTMGVNQHRRFLVLSVKGG